MLTLALPPELERVLAEQARARNTTPELLAIDSLQERFAPPDLAAQDAEVAHFETMAEYWKDFIGCLHSGEFVPGGAQMSTASGKKFAEGMVKKRAQGKL